jgi:CubicO group peptidase (beta-lactamase class C family)
VGTQAKPIDGHCDPAFACVRAALADNFEQHAELGAAVCVRIEGRTVVDLWGGHRDRARRRPWQRDTLVNAWSVGKGVLAMLALSLVERGQLRLDEPLRTRWPEFAAGGKQDVTLRTLLCHGAGLPSLRRRLPQEAWRDWDAMCAALAAQEPWWEPGAAHGYHVGTWGFLVGEVVRRALGCSPGRALRREIAGPLEADFFWGLPPQLHHRVAEVDAPNVVPSGPEQWAKAFPPTGDAERDTMVWHAYFNPPGLSGLGLMGSDAWLRAEVPSTNGQATARGVARLYDALLRGGPDGARLVGTGLLREATQVHADGQDRILGRPSRFGLGFQLPMPERKLGPSEAAFGHYGYGGLLGMADPTAGVAFGFLSSRPGDRWQTPRTRALLQAVYAALGSPDPS